MKHIIMEKQNTLLLKMHDNCNFIQKCTNLSISYECNNFCVFPREKNIGLLLFRFVYDCLFILMLFLFCNETFQNKVTN